jgi:hypothetical protein
LFSKIFSELEIIYIAIYSSSSSHGWILSLFFALLISR